MDKIELRKGIHGIGDIDWDLKDSISFLTMGSFPT